MANFKIPMESYYRNANELKSRTEEVTENFKAQVLNKIMTNSAGVDGVDLEELLNSAAVTKAKRLLEKIEAEHNLNLNNMATEGGANPLNDLVETDKEFASKFREIAQGRINSSKIQNQIQSINQIVQIKKNNQKLMGMAYELAKALKNSGENTIEFVKKIEEILNNKNLGELEKILNEPKILEIVSKNKKATDLFLRNLELLEKMGKLKVKTIDAIFSSKTMINTLDKYPKIWERASKLAGEYADGTLYKKFVNLKKESIGKVIRKTSIGNKLLDSGKSLATKVKKVRMGSGVAGTVGLIAEVGIRSIDDYKEDKHLGKAIVGGVVDTLFSLGPFSGAMTGAAFGPVGVVIGTALGTISMFAKMFDKNANKKTKKWVKSWF